jgi:hypothetical protein
VALLFAPNIENFGADFFFFFFFFVDYCAIVADLLQFTNAIFVQPLLCFLLQAGAPALGRF